MATIYWIALLLFVWTRPIDIYYRKTKKINGRIVSDHDYVKWAANIIALILVLYGVFS